MGELGRGIEYLIFMIVASSFIEKAIEKYTSACKQYIDIDDMCDGLGFEVEFASLNNHAVGDMQLFPQEGDKDACVIRLQVGTPSKTQRTIKAILLAKFFLQPEKLESGGYSIDVFELKDIKTTRHSRLVYLATRLALPESVIAQIDTESLNKPDLKACTFYDESFVMCSVKDHTVAMLVNESTTT